MEFQEFKAKTVEDAITEASIALGASSDKIEYEVIDEGTTGLLRLFSKDAVIRARIKEEVIEEPEEKVSLKPVFENEQKTAQKPAAKPAQKRQEKKQEVKPEEKAEVTAETKPKKKTVSKPVDCNQIKTFLVQILSKMDIDAEIKIEKDDAEKVININIDGDDTGDLIGKRGQTLDAIQYLVSIIVNKEQEDYYRVKLDTKDYRERRQKTLENLAKNIASKVKKTRKKVVLEPMNPYERSIIHSYLQSDKYVTTKSEGEEPNRRVVVYYKK